MNVKDIRRENLRSLARSIGGITQLAIRLGKSQSQISHLIGSRPIKNIGDRLASEIEHSFEKAHGWLDKEHFRMTNQEEMYGLVKDGPRILNWIPVLSWQQLISSSAPSHVLDKVDEFHPVNYEVSPEAFALVVNDDSMDSPIGISFPKGTMIIVDPSHIPTHSSYVICPQPQADSLPLFRQLIHDGKKRYLKPLNPRYEKMPLAGSTTITGVVRSMVFKLE